MSEDRTQPPSKRRRQLARQQGQVAHSPELTAAAGWLAAVVLLGILGDDLTFGLTNMVRGTLGHAPGVLVDPAEAVSRVRSVAFGLAWPLAGILAGFLGGALAAHQLQVRGLWATPQLVPNPARLWAYSSGPGLVVRLQNSAWSVIKALVLLAISAWTIQASWTDLLRLSSLGAPNLARATGQVALHLAQVVAAVLLLLGVVDYIVRYRQFESMLRTTPQEQREDQRVMEGDPAARAQRRRVARALRSDLPEMLAGATLLVTGAGGLTLILAGGPPPRRLTVRTIVRGSAGLRLRRSPEASQIPQVDAPEVARRLAHRPAMGSPIAAELFAELAAIWPAA